jgi:hypothetical protein
MSHLPFQRAGAGAGPVPAPVSLTDDRKLRLAAVDVTAPDREV